MQTYNGLNVPKTINPRLIISAFQNEMDYNKVEEYTIIMKAEMLSHSFPAIMGYPSIIEPDDIGKEFISGEEVSKKHLGLIAWYVTDGHHRSTAAIEANLPYIKTNLDYSTLTNETDFKNFANV